MNKKKIISALVALITVLVLCFSLFSCDKNKTNTNESGEATGSNPSGADSSTESAGGDGVPSLSTHDIITDGKVNYAVVRPDKVGDTLKKAATSLYSFLCSHATDSSQVQFTTDVSAEYLKNNKTHDKNAKEIIIGRTNYDETAAVVNQAGYGDYLITTVGNKIIITGWSEDIVARGVSAFTDVLRSASTDDKNISVTAESIEQLQNVAPIFNSLPVYDFEGTELDSTYDCGDECRLILINNASEKTHSDYMNKLEDAGFEKYTDNNMNNNLFATYTDDKYVVNVGFYPSKSEERIIIEPSENTNLPVLESQNTYKKVCDPMFFEVGVSTDNVEKANGMCFMMRLADGSFIIYDGGHKGELSAANNPQKDPKRQNARRIYEIMKEYSPDPNNLVVKAWVITHGHDDHLNCLRDFIPNYAASKVKIERLLINFPSYEQANMTTTGTSGADDALTLLAMHSPNTKITKIHPGYKFYLADAVIEFFYTLELYAPGNLTYYNTSSLVSRVYLGGQTILMTGDMSEDANSIILRLYGSYIKSDIVQVAHHGYAGGSTVFYRTVDPTWAFWPISSYGYSRNSTESRNEYFFKTGTNLKGVYVARFKTYACKLPINSESDIKVSDNVIY